MQCNAQLLSQEKPTNLRTCHSWKRSPIGQLFWLYRWNYTLHFTPWKTPTICVQWKQKNLFAKISVCGPTKREIASIYGPVGESTTQ